MSFWVSAEFPLHPHLKNCTKSPRPVFIPIASVCVGNHVDFTACTSCNTRLRRDESTHWKWPESAEWFYMYTQLRQNENTDKQSCGLYTFSSCYIQEEQQLHVSWLRCIMGNVVKTLLEEERLHFLWLSWCLWCDARFLLDIKKHTFSKTLSANWNLYSLRAFFMSTMAIILLRGRFELRPSIYFLSQL